VIIFGLRFAFFTHISGKKNAQFQNMCAKKRNDFRQLKRSYFRVKKCKTEKNLSKFLNNMAYKTVTSMRDCVLKKSLCKTWIVFILIKCICFIIKINHVWSRVKNIALLKHCFPKKTLFSQKPIVFQHVHYYIPLFWNEKSSLLTADTCQDQFVSFREQYRELY